MRYFQVYFRPRSACLARIGLSYYNPQPLYTATQDCTAKANATLRLGESVRAACAVCEVWRPETPAWTRDPRGDPSGAPVALLIGGAQELTCSTPHWWRAETLQAHFPTSGQNRRVATAVNPPCRPVSPGRWVYNGKITTEW